MFQPITSSFPSFILTTLLVCLFQVEIYAFGIEDAEIAELHSISSDLPHHVFLIPNFQLFEQLARSLHGGMDYVVNTQYNNNNKKKKKKKKKKKNSEVLLGAIIHRLDAPLASQERKESEN